LQNGGKAVKLLVRMLKEYSPYKGESHTAKVLSRGNSYNHNTVNLSKISLIQSINNQSFGDVRMSEVKSWIQKIENRN